MSMFIRSFQKWRASTRLQSSTPSRRCKIRDTSFIPPTETVLIPKDVAVGDDPFCNIKNNSQAKACTEATTTSQYGQEHQTRERFVKLDNKSLTNQQFDFELETLAARVDSFLLKLDPHKSEDNSQETTNLFASENEERCAICLTARATVCTYPCQHTVVCQLCFLRHLHSSVRQRTLQLHCVVCRTAVARVKMIAASNTTSRMAQSTFKPPKPAKHTSTCRHSLTKLVDKNIGGDVLEPCGSSDLGFLLKKSKPKNRNRPRKTFGNNLISPRYALVA